MVLVWFQQFGLGIGFHHGQMNESYQRPCHIQSLGRCKLANPFPIVVGPWFVEYSTTGTLNNLDRFCSHTEIFFGCISSKAIMTLLYESVVLVFFWSDGAAPFPNPPAILYPFLVLVKSKNIQFSFLNP
jgi:hypothetical protein